MAHIVSSPCLFSPIISFTVFFSFSLSTPLLFYPSISVPLLISFSLSPSFLSSRPFIYLSILCVLILLSCQFYTFSHTSLFSHLSIYFTYHYSIFLSLSFFFYESCSLSLPLFLYLKKPDT